MYSIFASVLTLLLLKFQSVQSALAPELASDKETLKRSLVHVDQFLKQVGQKINFERDYLQSVGRRNAQSQSKAPVRDRAPTIDGVSNEDYANLWFGANKFDVNPKTLNNRKQNSDGHVPKNQKNFSNYYKAVATFDEGEIKKETTIKLKNAIHDLRGLVQSDVDVKYGKNSTKLDTLRKMQEALKRRSKGKSDAGNTKKSKRDNDDNDDQFDVFGGMDFPEDSNLPSGIATTKPTTGGGPPPDILNDQYTTRDEDLPGPGPEVMATPSTTTVDYGLVLNPVEFGHSTTDSTIATYGDIQMTPQIDTMFLSTYTPDDFVAGLQAEMEKFHMGVFSITLLKILHMIIWKPEPVAKEIVRVMPQVIEAFELHGKFDEFEQPTKVSIQDLTRAVGHMPFDEMRSQVVLLHNGFLHRREMFSGDMNSLMDHIDELFTRDEAWELLESLEPLDSCTDPKAPIYKILEKILDKIMSPWRRIKHSPRGYILKTALKRAIQNHFYADDYSYNRRAITINLPAEFMSSASPPSTPPPNFRSANIKVYRIATRKDDPNSKNIYNTNLQTLYNNFMHNKNEQARKSQGNINAKPLFNKQLKNNLNIVNDKRVNNFFVSEKPAPLRINFNAKGTGKPNGNRIMIITNNNQAKSNIINKPGPVFRSGDSYVDFNVVNMSETLVRDGDQFELDMYPDVPIMVSDAPLTPPPPPPPNELNFHFDGDKLNLQVDGDKKVIFIKEKHDAPVGTPREDIDLKMSSSSSSLRKKKHHKKHHKNHKRTHGHNNLKEKLARIKKIVKKYRLGHRKSKHKHHHKRDRHKKAFGSLSIKETVPFSSPVMRNFNATKSKQISDRRFQIKDSLSSTRATPAIILSEYSTQVYAVRNNFIKSLRRKMMNGNARADWAKRASIQSDDEIALRRNLYKAMSLGGRGLPRRRNVRVRPNKRSFLRDSSATDEEAQLKNNIYNYFNNIQPV